MLLETRNLQEKDYQEVKQIYTEGIITGFATFETEAPDWETFNQKYLKHSRLVVLLNQELMGWATLSSVSKRHVYRGLAEVSIYIGAKGRGQGLGDFLIKKLITSSEENGIWTLQSVVFKENIASVKLHEHNDFRLVGYREKIGQMNEVWRDNLLFERRSQAPQFL